MTKTALENKARESKERIADKDRDLEEKKFKHQKIMDAINVGLKGFSSFVPAARGAKAVAKGANALQQALGRNDPEFYKQYVGDLDKFTNITSWIRLGYTNYEGNYECNLNNESGEYQIETKRSVPGLVSIIWIPSIGSVSNSPTTISKSPINQILMRTKEQVLKSNSRSNVPWEASDLGYNFLASGCIALLIAEFERAILVAQTYKADNAYYANAALHALGWDPEAIINDLPRARQLLILLKKRFNSAIVAPSGLSYYKKMLYLGSLWIKDSETKPAQVYTAVVDAVWRLHDTGEYLESIYVDRSSLDAYYNLITSMIQRLAENPDFVAMYADLRSAFGSKLMSFDESFDGSAQIEERYDSMAIEQVANVRTLPTLVVDEVYETSYTLNSMSVRQDSNGYLYQGMSNTNQGIIANLDLDGLDEPVKATDLLNVMNQLSHCINFHKDEISGDDVLDATRWDFYTTDWAKEDPDDTVITCRITNSDVAVALRLHVTTLAVNGLPDTNVISTIVYHEHNTVHHSELMRVISQASVFDWAPLTQHIFTNSVGSGSAYVRTVGEVQHLIELPKVNGQSINDICVLSEFYLNSEQFKI